MLTVKQIADIIRAELNQHPSQATPENIESAAEKIAAALPDYNQIAVTAAALENEVTSTLMDMTVATVLATLIEEEGGGRSNIGISPLSMDHMMKHYLYEVRNEGMIRHVSIKLREDSNLQDEAAWREPSNRHGVMHQDEDTSNAKPQAEPKVHDRPVWAVRIPIDGEEPYLRPCNDEDHARKILRAVSGSHPLAAIENRYCLHVDCPTTGCNHAEATSDA